MVWRASPRNARNRNHGSVHTPCAVTHSKYGLVHTLAHIVNSLARVVKRQPWFVGRGCARRDGKYGFANLPVRHA